MKIRSLTGLFSPFFRRRRMRRFTELFGAAPGTTILDVGGYPGFWKTFRRPASVTVVNLHPPRRKPAENGPRFVIADGRALPFVKGAFDVVFSNSVIEHLSTREDQHIFAAAVRQAGRGLWVQTPARCFPVEPHLMTPLIHYLPRRLQRRLLRRCTAWGLVAKPSPGEVDRFLAEVRLLSYREMRDFFPDCRILRERFLFFTKSYIAVRLG